MPVNRLPVSPSWENSLTTTAEISEEVLGIGGVITRGLKGLNPLRRTWNITIETTRYTELEDFLVSNQGKEIRIPYLDEGSVDGYIYRYSAYNVIYLAPNVRGFSLDCRQVRRLGVAPYVQVSTGKLTHIGRSVTYDGQIVTYFPA